MIKGTIFDIKKYALHDGPGIRTTIFFKGCPLHCLWCHNPEGQSPKPEIMVKPSKCLKECQECLKVCEPGALTKKEHQLAITIPACNTCGKCADVCPSQAIELVGQAVGADELMAEIVKDAIFHEESGGGVTFSGGEPLMQLDFLEALLEGSKAKDLHTTVDTSGYAPFEALDQIAGKVDLFLYDLKLMDDEKHKKFTGLSNALILENLKKLSPKAKKIQVRFPLIPTINDDDQNIQKMADFLHSLGSLREISLLPFHTLGTDKYVRLGKAKRLPNILRPKKEDIEKIQKKLTDLDFIVKTGD